MRILVTGGCGFIGSALVLHLGRDLGPEVATLADDPRHRLVEVRAANPRHAIIRTAWW